MKTSMLNKILPVATVLLLCLPEVRGTEINADHATIRESMAVGLVNINDGGSSVQTVPGFRITVSQDTTSETFTETIHHPGYYSTQEVIHEEYGYVEVGGYLQDIYEYGITSNYWVDDVWGDNGSYNEENEWVAVPYLITPGYWVEEWGDVYMGSQWVSGTQEWQLVNSYSMTEEVYNEGYTETEEVEYTGYQRPKIKLAATRTDANWVWQVPDADYDQSLMRDIFVLFDGGAKIPSREAGVDMALLADNLTFSRSVEGAGFNAVHASRSKAEDMELSSDRVFSDGAKMEDKAELSAQKMTFTYAYTNAQNQRTSKQSQISAEGAYFDGLVTLKGNVNVGGVVRLFPAGNLSMGIYTQGPVPVQP